MKTSIMTQASKSVKQDKTPVKVINKIKKIKMILNLQCELLKRIDRSQSNDKRSSSGLKSQEVIKRKEIMNKVHTENKIMKSYIKRATSASVKEREQTIQQDIDNTLI